MIDRINDEGLDAAQARLVPLQDFGNANAPRSHLERVERGVFLQTLAGGGLGALAGVLVTVLLAATELLSPAVPLGEVGFGSVLIGVIIGLTVAGFLGLRLRAQDPVSMNNRVIGYDRVAITVVTDNPHDAERIRALLASTTIHDRGAGAVDNGAAMRERTPHDVHCVPPR